MMIFTSVLRQIHDHSLKGWMPLRLIGDTSGVTAIEYGLIAALIAVAAVIIIGTVGTNLSSTFNTIATNL
jgi:pilus assembly protein Flp/PilA